MATVQLVITGDKQINAMLKELPKSVQRKFVRKAARPAVKAVLPSVKREAPRSIGALVKSLAVRSLRKSRVRIGLMITTREGWFKGKTFYGAFQEWGWKTGSRTGMRGHRTKYDEVTQTISGRAGRYRLKGERRKIPGKFYAKKATDSNREYALEIYRRGLREMIEEEMRAQGVKRA